MKRLIVIEPASTGYSAHPPDLPGCVSTGATRSETERNVGESTEFHLEGLREEGLEAPEPDTSSAYIEIEAP